MGRVLATIGVGLVCSAVGLGGCVATLIGTAGSLYGSTPASVGVVASSTSVVGSGGGAPAVPSAWVLLDTEAAASCPGLSWAVLAAIGRIESDSGQSTAPGVTSGANGAGAEGPMQFEPATFNAYATVGPGGAVPPSPYDPIDAVYTAAAMLCANGAGTPAGLPGALGSYDSTTAYVNTVVVLATALTAWSSLPSAPATALAFAAGQLGVPYRWGGTGEGGWDCSGLVQAAYAAAGVALPRVAQTQFDAGPAVTATPVEPGDLVFFGTGPQAVDHVGLYVGAGEMVDAPYTGTVVRIDPAAAADVIGATRPWA